VVRRRRDEGALQTIGARVLSKLRATDLVARLHADCFGVLLPDCELHDALLPADQLSKEISRERLPAGTRSLRVTASIGAIQLDSQVSGPQHGARGGLGRLQCRRGRAGRWRTGHVTPPGRRAWRAVTPAARSAGATPPARVHALRCSLPHIRRNRNCITSRPRHANACASLGWDAICALGADSRRSPSCMRQADRRSCPGQFHNAQIGVMKMVSKKTVVQARKVWRMTADCPLGQVVDAQTTARSDRKSPAEGHASDWFQSSYDLTCGLEVIDADRSMPDGPVGPTR
jgi:hypothetical protein